MMSGTEAPFVDYLVVCGLPHNAHVEVQRCSANAEDEEKAPLERAYVNSILGCYPHSRRDAPFHNEVLALCMPRGLRFHTQRSVPSSAVFHTFALIREDGRRIDGAALTFYEKVQTGHITAMLHEMQLSYVSREVGGEDEGVVIGQPFVHPPGQVTGGVHTLPRRRGQRMSRVSRNPRHTYYDAHKDTLYMSKCLCLLGRLPIIEAYETLLRSLHKLGTCTVDSPILPLESYVFWMLHELPLPSPGTTLKVSIDEPSINCSADIVCQRPSLELELPMYDHPLEHVLQLFPVDKLIKLYTCVLLEHQILLCSKEMHRLMLVAESLCTLMYPFRWQYTYVPILPHSQREFLDAPMPFIMGLCIDEEIPPDVYQSTVVVVDIDRGHVEVPEDLPVFPDRQELIAEICDTIKFYNQSTRSAEGREPQHPLDPQHRDDRPAGGGRIHGTDEFDRLYNEMTNKTPVRRAYNDQATTSDGHVTQTSTDAWKRMSTSFDEDALLNPPPLLSASTTHRPFDLSATDAVKRSMEIARRVGIEVPAVEALHAEAKQQSVFAQSQTSKRYFHDMKFNNAIREIFLRRFVAMLHSYEHFVIGLGQYATKEEYYSAREISMHTFDKAAFLSDQPDSHLKFLAAFLETQMFATFIDSKIVGDGQESRLLDRRIAQLQERCGEAIVRTAIEEDPADLQQSLALLCQREESFDYVVSSPHPLPGVSRVAGTGAFPTLQHSLFGDQTQSPQKSPWHVASGSRQRVAILDSPSTPVAVPLVVPDLASLSTSKTNNWLFVDQLLNEAKKRTKRMLVDKMGRREAVALGHSDVSITGVEENTLVASFCDLLERVWAHKAVRKQGKSALWTHLVSMDEAHKHSTTPQPMLPTSSNAAAEEDAGGLVTWMQGLQSGSEAAPAWSSSLLKAASYFANKLQNTSTQNLASAPASPYRQSVRQAPPQPPQSTLMYGRQRAQSTNMLARHSSFSDLAPSSWTPSPQMPLSARQASSGTLPNQHRRQAYGTPTRQPWSSRGMGSEDLRSYTSPRKQRSLSRPRSPPDNRPHLPPLPTDIAYDLKNVCRISDIKTDIGYARAFVRLSLERKLLHGHVQTLLGDRSLLRQLYKRDAFLRSDDEMEQFLFHVLSLNAADFRCFTNSFPKIKMQYQVLLQTAGGRFALTTASIFIRLAGSFGETPAIALPSNSLQFVFDHRNLGVLSTLRIGHKNEGEREMAKWYLEDVIIRNELTGQTYRFPCARWFGSNVDDGSVERLLVAEPYDEQVGGHTSTYDTSSMHRSATPSRARSPSSSRRGTTGGQRNPRAEMAVIEHSLGNCVNAIVKHFHATEANTYEKVEHRQQLTQLLCGDGALVQCLEHAFLYNFRSSRNRYYMWDYIERTCQWFYDTLRSADSAHFRHEQKVVMKRACKICARVGTNSTLGKDGKFHTWLLLAIRDKLLPGVLTLMAWTPITGESYNEPSFVRSSNYRNFLIRLLESLNEFTFELEASLTRDVEGKAIAPW